MEPTTLKGNAGSTMACAYVQGHGSSASSVHVLCQVVCSASAGTDTYAAWQGFRVHRCITA